MCHGAHFGNAASVFALRASPGQAAAISIKQLSSIVVAKKVRVTIWIPTFAGMTRRYKQNVIPAKAGIQ